MIRSYSCYIFKLQFHSCKDGSPEIIFGIEQAAAHTLLEDQLNR